MEAERGPIDNRAVMADQTTVLGCIPAGVHVATAEIELEASTLLVKELLRFFFSFRVSTPVVSSATRARCGAGLKKNGGELRGKRMRGCAFGRQYF